MPEDSAPERGDPPAPRRPFYALLADTSPLDLRLIGRTLLHAAIIGAVAGVMAVLFFGALELMEELVLGGLAGYKPLRADGEKVFSHLVESPTVRLWLLPIIPAAGALVGGILTAKVAPEAAGGGGNAMITAFHQHGGMNRDDFESDALIPALLASVVSYSIFISVYGESTLFAHAAHFPFFQAHLPLYALFALLLSLLAIVFLNTLTGVKKLSLRLPGPAWMRPGVRGLALGIFCAFVLWFVDSKLNTPGQGIGLLGSGYGAVQVSITGASWLPLGWTGVELLLLLCGAKLVAASLTLGSGGSAGDFAPSLMLGGLLGGAFSRAAQLLLHDPRIDPGAFALVGMGTFYGVSPTRPSALS